MMLHAQMCSMSKYIHSSAVCRLWLRTATLHSMSTCTHSLLVTVHCVPHHTETAPYAPAPSARAASSRRRISHHRQDILYLSAFQLNCQPF